TGFAGRLRVERCVEGERRDHHCPVSAIAAVSRRTLRPRARRSLSPSAIVNGRTDRATARASRELAGVELPARIASRTLKRVLRRVEVKTPASSTGRTMKLAARMCQGFAA